MGQIRVYDQDGEIWKIVSYEIREGVLEDGASHVWIELATTLRQPNGSAIPKAIIESLADIAPGAGAATDLTDLVYGWVSYWVGLSQLAESSSSSSSDSSASSSGSSVSSASSQTP